ncbi:hypothetical protein PG984_016385 [Apiospora sp. TS-2023a]
MSWYVLREYYHHPQSDFATVSDETAAGSGLLRLGHIMPEWNLLDNVLNTDDRPLTLPSDVPCHTSTVCESGREKWDEEELKPGHAADGISIRAAAAAAMNLEPQDVRLPPWTRYMRVKALETRTIEPTETYVESSVADERVASFLAESRYLVPTRTLYMITGMMIARGAETDVISRPDFVWAVRLTKLSRGLLGSWSQKEYSKSATLKKRGLFSDISEAVHDWLKGRLENADDVDDADDADEEDFTVLT